ncbi:ABC transporter permease [Clostridium sp. DJ247]|uniref:ABC transporter permease n=1 Tax=Clostridium sp. DJ247 TaxID=2726188 RepID=UPI0016281E63|nr:ABC transporter permease subunit [Clostridium sp. DJ247]MBC2581501.1 ABC transporter permease subunit [Clostridium sp. DJ247]
MNSIKRLYYALGKKNFFSYCLFGIFIIIFFLPLTNLAMLAFADNYQYPSFFPQAFSFKWWSFVLSQDNLAWSMILSFIIAIITTVLSIIICIPAAYAFARYEFPLRRVFLFSFLISNAFPKIGLYVMIGVVFFKLNLMGTMLGVILIHIVNTIMFMTWIPAGAFKSVHRQQEEAARDVGATPWQAFRYITLPLAMPGIITASVFTFLESLEEAQGTLLVGIPNIKTIPVIMYSVIIDYPATAGAVFAFILIIPTIILLVFLRKFVGAEGLSKGFNIK